MNTFSEIDHPADLALRVFAHTIAGLFKTALEGMYFLIFNQKILLSVDCDKKTTALSFQGQNHEDLLIDWLSELNYKLEVEKKVAIYCKSLKFKEISGDIAVNAHLVFKDLNELKLVPVQEIKAVTYHQMDIKKEKTGFSTVIVFDV